MTASYDVAIIGGGVIGLTTAYYLAREGVRVTVLDKGDLGQEASWAGAGILSGGNPKRARSPIGQLRALSIALYPELSAELLERTGIDNGYRKCGGLELRRSSEALERQRIDNLVREERGEGLHCEVFDGKQLRELEPALAEDLPGAVYFPDMAQVRNPRHLKALIAGCGLHGVTFQPGCPVFAFVRDGARIAAVRTPAGALHANQFLIAAGSWSGMLMDLLGIPVAIRPVRGQIAMLSTSPPCIQRVLMAGLEYMVPRPDGRVLVGSTEEDVGFAKRTTAEAQEHLLNLAKTLVPRLGEAHVERCWAGLRPGSPDGRPILGRVPDYDNFFIAAGHFRSGIQLSPGTGKVMKELMLGASLSVPVDAFRIDRTSISGARATLQP